MGWSFGWDKKQEIVKMFTEDEHSYKVLDYRLVGNVLWVAAESKKDGDRSIVCVLLEYDRSGRTWGYKAMDESAQPYYYSCPPSFFDLVPGGSPEWRQKVLAA